jgi:superfamily I DNA/RNA helicase
MPLSVCYRCPDVVIDEAQKYVPHIEGTGKEGEVDTIGLVAAMGLIRPGDMVISRTNAPLVGIYFQLIANDVKAKVKGRNYTELIGSFLKLMEQQPTDDMAEATLQAYEIKTSNLQEDDPKLGLFGDLRDCIRVILEHKTFETYTELKVFVDEMFTDEVNTGGFVMLSSIHRSKGLENPRVFYLLNKGMPLPGGGQESNLGYVGITRAQESLYYVQNR